MALIPVNGREIATVVTYMEMTRRPRPSPVLTSPLRLTRWDPPDIRKYRVLFKRVGEPWLWFSRLTMNDHELSSIIHHPQVAVHPVLDPKGIEVGLVELDFRDEGLCELSFFGLVPQLAGQGLGRWLISQALTLGWRNGVRKMTVHTSSTDDPRAFAIYMKAGFVPAGRAVLTFEDPRLTGILAADAAPHVPILK